MKYNALGLSPIWYEIILIYFLIRKLRWKLLVGLFLGIGFV